MQPDPGPMQLMDPSVRSPQSKQFVPGHASVHVAHPPALLQTWMVSQQAPLQQTLGAAQSGPGWPFGLGCPHWPVAALQVWQAGQLGGHGGGDFLAC